MSHERRPQPLSRRAFTVGSAMITGLSLAAVQRGNALAGTVATPDAGATPVATPGGTPTSSGPSIVVRVAYVGGFVTPESSLTAVPTYQLSDDGQEISQGVQILIYPPPALPSLQSAMLTEEGMEIVLAAADEAGLLGTDQEFINPNVTDLPNLVITVTVDGRTVTTTAYGLDFLDPSDTSELAAARDRIQPFLALIANPPSLRSNGEVAETETFYAFTELQYVAIPAASFPAAGEVSNLEGATQTSPVEWPLETSLAEAGQPLGEAIGGEGFADIFPDARVATIDGAELAAVRPLAEQANQLTIWQSDGADWVLLFRPLLPGEVGDLARPANEDQAV